MSDIARLIVEQLKQNQINNIEEDLDEVPANDEPVETPSFADIKILSQFSLMDLRNGIYDNDEQVIHDLSQLVRYLHESEVFLFKAWCSGTQAFVIREVKWGQMKNMLSTIELAFGNTDKYTAWDCLNKYIGLFAVQGVQFTAETSKKYFNHFHGWAHVCEDPLLNSDLIVPFLTFTLEIICDSQEAVYYWLLSWISYIIQNVGERTETAVILMGDEGIGKNVFSNCIAKLFEGYSIANLADTTLLTGAFNDIVRGQVLIVVNEVESAIKSRNSAERIRALITEPTVVIKQKYLRSQVDVNISNFMFLTNNEVPIRMGPTDRRYMCAYVSPKKMNDHAYFKALTDAMTPEFFKVLHVFFAQYDISGWDKRGAIPFTYSKAQIIYDCATTVENFVMDHYDELKKGMFDTRIYAQTPKGISKDMFSKRLGRYTTRYQEQSGGVRLWKHKLTPDAVHKFGPTAQMNCQHTQRLLQPAQTMDIESDIHEDL